MKKLAVLTLAVVLTSIRLSATTILFDPNFNNQTGYTQVTSGGGTATYSNGTMTDGDISNSIQAYATGSGQDMGVKTISSQFTFTPTFTANPNFSNGLNSGSGNYEGVNLFSIYGGGNNPLLSVNLYVSTYNNDDQIGVYSGLQYGGGALGGAGTTQYYAPGNINSLSGQTLTFTSTTKVDNSNEDPNTHAGFVLTEHGVLTNSLGQVLYNFDYTRTSGNNDSIVGGDYNPAYADLMFNVGAIGNGAPNSFDSTTGNPNGMFLLPGATVAFSNVSVTVPEPSTYALLLGGLAMLALGIRRKING